MLTEMNRIVAIIHQLGGPPTLDPDEDIYRAGFSSIRSLQLLLELESTFGATIPDQEFVGARTPRSLCAVVANHKEPS